MFVCAQKSYSFSTSALAQYLTPVPLLLLSTPSDPLWLLSSATLTKAAMTPRWQRQNALRFPPNQPVGSSSQ